jgi:8-oxo-dGTP diphosphatase
MEPPTFDASAARAGAQSRAVEPHAASTPPAGRGDSQRSPRRGVVAVIVDQERLLVIRRSQHVVAPRAFCFPGGAIEAGETEAEALVREIQEELGVCIRPVRLLWKSVTPWNVQLAWWLAEAEESCVWTPNSDEVESMHWLTPAEMHALPELLQSNHHFLEALRAGEITLGPNHAAL